MVEKKNGLTVLVCTGLGSHERCDLLDKSKCEQAGAELGKAQLKLGPGRIKALAKSRKVVWD